MRSRLRHADPRATACRAEQSGRAARLEADAGLTARVLVAVTELFGALNFELFGQVNNAIDERQPWFDYQARAHGRPLSASRNIAWREFTTTLRAATPWPA